MGASVACRGDRSVREQAMRARGNEAGQVMVLVLGLALVAFAAAGLAVDGTRAFLMRRTLQSAADAAALAGSGALDEEDLYTSGGRVLALDPEAARTAARLHLSSAPIQAEAAVDADDSAVRVVLRSDVPTSFLGLIGIDTIGVGAESVAEPLTEDP